MKRSLEQNDLFHPWCRDIAAHLQAKGARVSERMVKELCKAEFGPRITITVGNKTREVVKPSSAYSVEEMTDVLNLMQVWAAMDLGLELKGRE